MSCDCQLIIKENDDDDDDDDHYHDTDDWADRLHINNVFAARGSWSPV